MMRRSKETKKHWLLPLAVLIAALVRFPFWAEAWRTPLDADTAIIGLMARHPAWGLTLWGQPYGSPLEACLAAPFLWLGGWTPHALRLFYFLLGLALVPMAYALGKRLHPAAAFPAALLTACPPAYFLLLSSMPPPLYPTTLLLCGALLILAIDVGERLASGAPASIRLSAWGALAGLALWTHLVAISAVAATAVYVLVKSRGRRVLLPFAFLPLLLAASPLWIRTDASSSPMRLVRGADARRNAITHLAALIPELHRPLGGVIGTHVPIVADDGRHVVSAPPWIAVGLAAAYSLALLGALLAARRSQPARLLVLAAFLALLVFLFPLRARPNTIRYLTPLYVPLAALVAWAPSALWSSRRALMLVLGLSALHLAGARALIPIWRHADRAAPPFLRPDYSEVLRVLRSRGIQRAYASQGPAYRLTFESGESIVVSQPRNERFPRFALPYHDEVRFAKHVAWILTPEIPSDLPTPEAFESGLRAIGGTWRRIDAGPAAIYCDFAPPSSSRVKTIHEAGVLGDGDPRTGETISAAAPRIVRLTQAVQATGLVMASAAAGASLPSELDLEISGDGASFELVHERRRRGYGLWWANGHPEYVKDPSFCSVVFDPRPVRAIRIAPCAGQSGFVGEILLRFAGEKTNSQSWAEWLQLDLGWRDRRAALARDPRADRDDWYYRMAVAWRQR